MQFRIERETCTNAIKQVPGQISTNCHGANDAETYRSQQFQVELLKLYALLPTNCLVSFKRIPEGPMSEESLYVVQVCESNPFRLT